MDTNEYYKVETNHTLISLIVVKTFELYRRNLQFNCLPVIKTQDTFSLLYGTEQQKRQWIDLFQKSVKDYAKERFDMEVKSSFSSSTNLIDFQVEEMKNEKSVASIHRREKKPKTTNSSNDRSSEE